jgi:hypothetical protein
VLGGWWWCVCRGGGPLNIGFWGVCGRGGPFVCSTEVCVCGGWGVGGGGGVCQEMVCVGGGGRGVTEGGENVCGPLIVAGKSEKELAKQEHVLVAWRGGACVYVDRESTWGHACRCSRGGGVSADGVAAAGTAIRVSASRSRRVWTCCEFPQRRHACSPQSFGHPCTHAWCVG